MYQKKKILIILISVLIIMVIFPALNAIANNLEFIEFLDDNFKKALIEQGIDRNKDGEISKTEAESVNYSLDINNKNIENISGIEYFINTEFVYLYNNYISDISALKEMNNLKYVEIQGNKLDCSPIRKYNEKTMEDIDFLIQKGVTVYRHT